MDTEDKNKLFFYNKKKFFWAKELEGKIQDIKNEFESVLNSPVQNIWKSTHDDYVDKKENIQAAWKTYTMMFMGVRNRKLCASCPLTHEAMSSIPEILSYEFSMMDPNTHILPHKGYSRMILRCHLPIIVPEGKKCALRVGDETQFWEEGSLMIFDDSHEHEAWNKSDQKRAVLMFDIAHPNWEYSAKEIARYRAANITDENLLKIAPKEMWQQWVEDGYFPEY